MEKMNEKFDSPKNELENEIVKLKSGEISGKEFIIYLLQSDGYVCTLEDQFFSEESQVKLKKNPSLFSITYPEYSTICIYSHTSRIEPTSKQYSDFKYGCQIQVGAFLKELVPGAGITLNPYWDNNLEWNPSQTEVIKGMIQ